MNYSILFKEFPLDDLETIAGIISQIYQITLFDARTKIRKGWGFLEHNATEERAQRMTHLFAEHNIAVLAIPTRSLHSLRSPKMMVGFKPDAGGFVPHLQQKEGPSLYIAWQDVLILAAGGFNEEVIRLEMDPRKSCMSSILEVGVFMVVGLPLRFSDKRKTTKAIKTNRFISFGEIVTRQGDALYFNPDRFDFSGLGDQKQFNVALNYRMIFSEFSRLCPVSFNWGARFLLNDMPLSMASYLRTKDFETELRWLFNVLTFRGSS